MSGFGKFLKDNGLSLAFGLLFVLTLVGTVVAGRALQAESPASSGPRTGVWAYAADPEFLRGIFGNWQAALLQLLTLIVFAIFLRQRGASHSRKPEDAPNDAKRETRVPWFGRQTSWLYSNSLSLAFLALFAAAFVVFFLADWRAYLHDRARMGEPPIGWRDFLFSARLWFDTFQTWQAEFFAMGLYLVLSIFLRQDDSSESKPVGSSDEATGETNE